MQSDFLGHNTLSELLGPTAWLVLGDGIISRRKMYIPIILRRTMYVLIYAINSTPPFGMLHVV